MEQLFMPVPKNFVGAAVKKILFIPGAAMMWYILMPGADAV